MESIEVLEGRKRAVIETLADCPARHPYIADMGFDDLSVLVFRNIPPGGNA